MPNAVKRAGVSVGNDVEFFGMPLISLGPVSQIVLGDRVSLCSVPEYTALGVTHPIILRTLRVGARIEIGDDTGISGATICAALNVTIGRDCLLGANVIIADTDFHPLDAHNRRYNNNPVDIQAKPISIGNNVFIGTGAIILKGVTVGHNSVIGAGAVVVHDVPKNSIAAGNPARVIGAIVETSCI